MTNNSSNLVMRLRAERAVFGDGGVFADLTTEAADEIERLTAQNELRRVEHLETCKTVDSLKREVEILRKWRQYTIDRLLLGLNTLRELDAHAGIAHEEEGKHG